MSGPLDPPQSANVHAIHDARRHRMVLVNGDNFGELWQCTLRAKGRMDWKRVPVAGAESPAYRQGFSAVYDSLHDRVIVFGGVIWNLNSVVAFDDTWALSLGDAPEWSRIAPSGERPPVRAFHVATFDPVRDRMVIFGGSPEPGGRLHLDDTWVLELRGTPTWRRFAWTGPAPIGRTSASAVRDPWNDRMVVFGGWNGGLPWQQQHIFDDTWALSLAGDGEWSRLAIAAPLYARQEHAAIMDPVSRRMLVTGGNPRQWGPYLRDTWALTLDSGAPEWVQLATAGENPAVGQHAAMFSPERGSLIQFGGLGTGNEHFELDLATLQWSRVNANAPETFPPRRSMAKLLPDESGTHLLMLGGIWYDCPGDLWRFDLQGHRGWQSVPVTGVPAGCSDHDVVFDPVRRRLLAFACRWNGGLSQCMFEVWQLPLDGARVWSRIEVPGEAPPGREWSSLVYDPRRDRVLMFGGAFFWKRNTDYPEDLDDLWAFSLGEPGWERITTTNSPGPRHRHAAVFDAARDQMLVFAGARWGYRLFGGIHDAWILSLDDLTWTRLPDVPPAFGQYGGSEASAALDPLRDRILVTDGGARAWSLPLTRPTAWGPLDIRGESPPPRLSFGLAFDSRADRLLLYAGMDGEVNTAAGESTKGDLWALEFSRRVDLALLRHGWTNPAGHPRHRVEVAILGDAGFSPDTVDVESVTLTGVRPFGSEGPTPSHRRRPGDGPAAGAPERRDVNGDGRTDLVLSFVSDGLSLDPSLHEAVLRARTPTFEVTGRLSPSARQVHARASVPDDGSDAIGLRASAPDAGMLRVHYRLPQRGSARLEVFDLAGRRVLLRDIEDQLAREGDLRLEVSGLRAGVYLLRLQQRTSHATARAVVLR